MYLNFPSINCENQNCATVTFGVWHTILVFSAYHQHITNRAKHIAVMFDVIGYTTVYPLFGLSALSFLVQVL